MSLSQPGLPTQKPQPVDPSHSPILTATWCAWSHQGLKLLLLSFRSWMLIGL